jgi:hypothetical protein
MRHKSVVTLELTNGSFCHCAEDSVCWDNDLSLNFYD